jgi:beta-lactamase class A
MSSRASRAALLRTVGIPLACLLAGGAVGYRVREARTLRVPGRSFSVTREGGYGFVNPLLECDAGPALLGDELTPFRARVETFVRDELRFPGVEGVAVYFRELNDGAWFSLGDAERFTPASLRKVPLMIAVLRHAERTPGLLDEKLPFLLLHDHNAGQTFQPSVKMVRGEEYTVAELVRRMIVYSDNNAFMVLSAKVNPAELQRTYEKLDLRAAGSAAAADVSAQTYASFFRVLYNASYVRKDLSEWALSLLAQSEFRDGIVRGLPAGVTVAHKFGESRDDLAGKVQLHDCGIVYAPGHPYLLCVMTRGTSFDHLDDGISAIARIVHREVTAQVAAGR